MSMLEQLQATREIYAASEGLDLTPFDNLTTSFNDVEQGFQLRLAEKDELLAEAQAEIARLKSVNYDLMMAAAPAPEDGDGDGQVDADGDGEDDDEPSEGRAVVDSMLD